jgi:hypothetical protein
MELPSNYGWWRLGDRSLGLARFVCRRGRLLRARRRGRPDVGHGDRMREVVGRLKAFEDGLEKRWLGSEGSRGQGRDVGRFERTR